jgi:2-methylcitrate dehydratase PrpD
MNAGPQTWRVAEFARTVRWEDLPADVRTQAIRCVLDLCGSAVAGSRTEAAWSATTYALYAHGTGPSTIIGTGAKCTPVGAAPANGFATSALDLDDGYRPVKGHPGAVVFPAVLATAEVAGSGGIEFLIALVVGYEVAMRAGAASCTHSTTFTTGAGLGRRSVLRPASRACSTAAWNRLGMPLESPSSTRL